MPLLPPDLTYRLGVTARARLRAGVDPDALERLLQHFPVESRAAHLEMFSVQQHVVDSRAGLPDISVLDRISDPVLQRLLEEVWQPYWATVPDAQLDMSGGPPGRELARSRRKQDPQR